ncbi:HAD family phosphatase [Nocardioides sp. SOB77]|uniref:HAD family phosphatase n=1 Tax=Nocardioides oceani TaxID=3058369 RepID=A0ABT8FD23_9ACTN|nr:HAD family phosphatase [Nocardioides oceani]MDN4172594.1 HAD family phosphatase [Nocardioides oceani]
MPQRPDPELDRADHEAPDLSAVRTLLLDADGNLFASEEPAFAASTGVTNDLLEELGSDQRWAAADLQAAALGRNFRSLALDLAAELGARLEDDDLERWVAREQEVVTSHLAATLRPDPLVTRALERLGRDRELAVVSSSALGRLAACFTAAELDDLLPAAARFSAQDSLPTPTSKPDPAVYLHALERLGLDAHEALAVEDAVSGARSAVAAGIPTVGNLVFVPEAERAERRAALLDAGAVAVVEDWDDLVELLGSPSRPATQEVPA